MKIHERSLEALLSSAPRGFATRSCILARLASLAQIGELVRRLKYTVNGIQRSNVGMSRDKGPLKVLKNGL